MPKEQTLYWRGFQRIWDWMHFQILEKSFKWYYFRKNAGMILHGELQQNATEGFRQL